MTALAVAVVAGVCGLVGTILSVMVGRRDNDCKRQLVMVNRELEIERHLVGRLSRRNEVMLEALLGLLPEQRKFALLAALDDVTTASSAGAEG